MFTGMSQGYLSFYFAYIQRAAGIALGKLRIISPVLIVIIICLAAWQALQVADAEAWTQWRGSLEHTGVDTGDVPEDNTLLWKYRTGGQVQSSPVFHNGTVIMGSDDGRLYCFDAITGELQWRFSTNDSVQSTVLILNNRAYFGSLDGIFYCITLPDTSQGQAEPEEIWRYDCGQSIVSSAHAYSGSVFFGCLDGYLYRLSIAGVFIWRASLGSEIWASPLIDSANNRVFIGAINGDFASIEMDDGNVTWTVDCGEIYSSGCLNEGTIFLCGGNAQEVYAIDADNGSFVWTFDTGYDTYSSPSVADGSLYFGSFEYAWSVPAVDPNSDGEINASEVLWSTPTEDFQGGSSPLITDDNIYIGSDDRNLYCIDRVTGAVGWNYTTGGYVYSSPALYNGSIYFGSLDDFVYCLGKGASQLYISIVSSADEILSSETAQITITVFDENGTLSPFTALSIVLSAGEIEVLTGTISAPDRVLTDSGGRAVLLFKPPPVSSRSTVEISITAETAGIQPGIEVATIIVEPGEEDTDDEVKSLVDPNEKRMPFYIILIAFIVIDIILAIAILRYRSKKRGKESSDKGEAVENGISK
jgi:outer membrane protein assembly factor BamB